MKKITQEWIAKAEEDYLVATRELGAKPPALDAVCFHAQQCIEKYMKAILQENDIAFEKIHCERRGVPWASSRFGCGGHSPSRNSAGPPRRRKFW